MEVPPMVTKVKVVRPYVLDLEFSDGTRREVDLGPEIQRGKIYDALKHPEFSAQAYTDGDTVAWPNGADFAPESLYHDAKSPTRR
jgi:Protein of unknown function (DUF2442)